MSNVLEFFIRMRDLTRSGLASAVSNTQSSTTRMQRALNTVTSATQRMGQGFIDASRHIRQTIRDMQNLERTSSSGTSMRKIAMGLTAGLSLAAGVSFAKDSVQKAMQYGMTEKSFGVLTGSAARGKSLAGELNQLQQNTILGPEVFKAAQTMMAFGVETEKVVQTEKMLGDIAMGNRDKFEALTLAFSQTTAAGRLMGQDLLQYVNAGFNPLQVMSEHWEQFGLKSKKSVGELKEMMEKGQISAAAVTKAFEVATGAGGKFAGMMEQMAETSGGRLQILEGQYENFKIQVGNALMPLAEELMKAGSATLEWLNITKTAPQILAGESAEIHGLVNMISVLNEGNGERARLIEKLVNKYPDLFGGIDKEKIKNGELLDMLNKVNDAYKGRIEIATSQLMADTNTKMANSEFQEYIRNQAIADAYSRGDKAGAQSLMTWGERNLRPFGNNADYFGRYAQEHKAKYEQATTAAQGAIRQKDQQEHLAKMWEFSKLANDNLAMQQRFGNRGADEHEFRRLAASPIMQIEKMQALLDGPASVSPKNIAGADGLFTGGKTKAAKSRGATDAAQGITGGGPRQVIINGVKFCDKVEIHQPSGRESAAELEKILAEMYMRILNSGAKLQ